MKKKWNKSEIIWGAYYAKAQCWSLENHQELVGTDFPVNSAVLPCMARAFGMPTIFQVTISLEVKLGILIDS